MPDSAKGLLDIFNAWWGTLTITCAGAYGYGRLSRKARDNTDNINKLGKMFTDGDGNQRLMSLAEHARVCRMQQSVLYEKFDRLNDKIDTHHESDAELKKDIKELNKSVLNLAAKIDRDR